jgi:hypothetical protein
MAEGPINQPTKKGNRTQKPQLRVVLDTNALYVSATSLGSASDLLREEIASLVLESKYPDLDIFWYLPEVVRHERQYQMESEALKLRGPINKIERLLGHNLALTDKHLLDHVKTKIDEKERELDLREIKLDLSAIDWAALIQAALYRKAPFQAGEKEKGFRDALVLESYSQAVAASPKMPNQCRVVLVTSDGLLAAAARERVTGQANASVLVGVDELRGLINTLVSNVSEDFIEQLKPKASKLFFTSAEDKDTIYFTERIGEQIREKYKDDLTKNPEGTKFRTNKVWYIGTPNFSRKDGKRIYWLSRVELEVEAGVAVKESEPKFSSLLTLSSLSPTAAIVSKGGQPATNISPTSLNAFYGLTGTEPSTVWDNIVSGYSSPAEKTVITQKR